MGNRDTGKDKEDTAANTAVAVEVAVESSATADIATAEIAAVAVASSAVAEKSVKFAEAVAAETGNRKSVAVLACLAAAAVSTAVEMCACGSK